MPSTINLSLYVFSRLFAENFGCPCNEILTVGVFCVGRRVQLGKCKIKYNDAFQEQENIKESMMKTRKI